VPFRLVESFRIVKHWYLGGDSVSSVQSVERAFAILRCLGGGPAGVSDLAERVHLPKSTVARLLSTLQELGAVEQAAVGGDYRVGSLIAEISAGVQPGASLESIARPHLVELVEATGVAAALSVLDGHEVVYLDQVTANTEVQMRDWTGERVAAHVTSAGFVLLAHAPRAQRDQFLAGRLERFTDKTMVKPALLRSRLAAVADRGTAWVYGEFDDEVNSVAAPIRDSHGVVVAAVHAHGPSYRFPADAADAERLEVLLAQTAERISSRLANAGATERSVAS
jgi:DNA-binding IclR family transcriptional regulator